MHLLMAFILVLIPSQFVSAEPWLSNRYAQNCAACHAPGRLNRVTKERRCTLTCQGCHVSPQGGGMRNQYGIWNQQRWLRSSRYNIFRDKGTPAPLNKQAYYEELQKIADSATSFYGGKKPGKGRRPQQEESVAKEPRKKGDPDRTLVIRQVAPPSRFYDQYSSSEWRAIIPNEKLIGSVIPQDDPYWLERKTGVYASGDFRYFILSSDKPIPGTKNSKTAFTLMAADLGVRLRPFSTHKFSGVVEARFLNGPNDQKPEEGFDTAQVKSAYILVDDLSYNSYVMGGLYRPNFGNHDPDHTSLASDISGLSQRAYYRGVSFGTAPNVPFLIVNYLKPYKDSGSEEHLTTDGYVITAGGRFVSFGASASASLWKTNFQESGQARPSARDMMALTAGGTFWRYIVNFEFIRAQVDSATNGKNAGNVMTVQNKLRMFRENYMVLNYGSSNVARNLAKGSGTETMVGFKSFPISNLEIEGLYVMRDDKITGPPASSTSTKMIQVQLHAYF